jgi:RAD51-like protein 2
MVSAFDALTREECSKGIATFCNEIDSMLGNGFQTAAVTELAGMAGLGKTQICMQLCANVQIPAEWGGLEGKAIFIGLDMLMIDCEGSFVGSRMREICKGTCAAIENNLSYEDLLHNITLVKVHDLAELIAQINSLETVLSADSKIKLVVIDSIAFFFRSYNGDYSERGRILLSLAQTLRKLAQVYDVAIVVTNQMTTKIQPGSSGGSVMVPALGESWGHSW